MIFFFSHFRLIDDGLLSSEPILNTIETINIILFTNPPRFFLLHLGIRKLLGESIELILVQFLHDILCVKLITGYIWQTYHIQLIKYLLYSTCAAESANGSTWIGFVRCEWWEIYGHVRCSWSNWSTSEWKAIPSEAPETTALLLIWFQKSGKSTLTETCHILHLE